MSPESVERRRIMTVKLKALVEGAALASATVKHA